MHVTFTLLSGDLPSAFQSMTTAALRPQLRGLSASSALLAMLAVGDGQPIGLGVAEVGPHGVAAKIHSLYVVRALWGHGIGTHLLRGLENALLARGCTDVALRYTTQSPTTPAFEHILRKSGWSPPQTQLIMAQFRQGVENSKWAQHRGAEPPYALFPWVELTAVERQAMEAFRGEVPAELWPFSDSQPPDPASSLGLRYGSEVVGWMITHPVHPKLVRFTMLYVRERWRTRASSFILVAESVRRMFAGHGQDAIISLGVQPENTPMVQLIERKWKPWMVSRSELRASAKSLTPVQP